MASAEYDLPAIKLPAFDVQTSTRTYSPVSQRSVMTTMSSCSQSPSPYRRSSMMSNTTNGEYKLHQRPIEKRRLGKAVSMACVSYRLNRRKELHQRCCQVNDVMCIFSVFGIVLMIVENELSFVYVDHHDTIATWFLKLIITVSTIVLIGLLLCYHYFNMNLYCVNNSIDQWRVGLTGRKIGLIILEILICAIHPVPRHFPVDQYSEDERNNSNSTMFHRFISTPVSLAYVPVDVALGLPMFARLYLWGRFMTFHPHVVQSASSQSLGYLTKVPINFTFVIKTHFRQSPIRCLVVFCTIVFSIGSWSLRACDFTSNNEHISILDATWFFITTFTTVGYGDMAPTTYCSRSVATLACVTGILVAALLIAVVSQKLKLYRWETYLHTFVLNSELAKVRTHNAANAIKFVWKMWYMKKLNKHRSIQYIQAQRKFFKAIYTLNSIKQKKRKLIDHCVSLPELLMVQRDTSTRIDETAQQMASMKLQMGSVEKKLDDVNHTIETIQNTLSRLLDRGISL